ncbi:response regulator transcription factor [Vreelandella massiliensis]|uniref:response regulator transcription factor n=1 Tax=Vreelandella massiliensis TaxID=1816686 RepID=UPI0009F93FE0|nr:response regulator transcription factor [Halomonas massiliensis]
MHIGVLEDDPIQQRFLAHSLNESLARSVTLDTFERASGLLKALQKHSFDLLIIDWYLPDADGMQLVQQLRYDYGWSGPILFITASQGENDVVMALESGADDFLTKPIYPAELRARLTALARRAGITRAAQPDTVTLGAYAIDQTIQSITLNGKAITLTPREYQLAALFFTHIGRLFSREHLLETVWGVNASLTTRTVDTHVSRLRKKLTLDGTFELRLKSVYQYGYRLVSAVEK